MLQNAVADGARIATVNLLTFDYYFGTQQDMVADTESAAAGLFSQLQSLYPTTPARQLWHMIGVTEMPGIDDFGPDETFSTANAVTILHWARHQGHRADLVLGAAARQRRLPRHQGRGHLLRREPADVVLQPRLRALHALAERHEPLASRYRIGAPRLTANPGRKPRGAGQWRYQSKPQSLADGLASTPAGCARSDGGSVHGCKSVGRDTVGAGIEFAASGQGGDFLTDSLGGQCGIEAL